MPLDKSKTKAAFGNNVSELMHSGHKQDQALAIAYRIKRGKTNGGKIMPQSSSISQPFPMANRQAHSGMIHSPVAGRTDKLPIGVKPNSYVIPSDIVSGIGQGNSMAGAHALNQMFKTGPYGTEIKSAKTIRQKFADGGMVEPGNIDLTNRPVVRNPDGSISTVRSMSFNDGRHEVLIPTVHPQGHIMQDEQAIDHYRNSGQHLGKFDTPENATSYAQQIHEDQSNLYSPKRNGGVVQRAMRTMFADGGAAGDAVDIVAAGGEYVVPPEVVAQIGQGDLEHGHNILDGMVKHIRKKTIKTLKKLPKPKAS